MKINLYILMILTFWALGCQERTLETNLIVEPKPVVIGFLDTLWGVRVFVGQTTSPLSKPDTNALKADIHLYENDLWIEKLQLSNEKLYISSPTFRPKTNVQYALKVKMPLEKDTIYSENVQLNSVVPIQQIRYIYTDLRKVAVHIYIDIEDPNGWNGYGLQVFRSRNDTIFDDPLHAKRTIVPPKSPLYSDKIFEGQPHTFVLENISIEKNVNNKKLIANEIRVALFSFSKNTFDFWNTLNTPEPTIGDLFFEPNTFTNQMKNGIGLFGTYQISEKKIKL